MSSLQAWIRRQSGAIVAVLVTLLALGPSFDALICADELPLSGLEQSQVLVADGEQGSPGETDLGHPDACMHGHCHHGAAALAKAEVVRADLTATGQRLEPGKSRALAATLTYGLKRPPRA